MIRWLVGIALAAAVLAAIGLYVRAWLDCDARGGAYVRGAWSMECVARR